MHNFHHRFRHFKKIILIIIKLPSENIYSEAISNIKIDKTKISFQYKNKTANESLLDTFKLLKDANILAAIDYMPKEDETRSKTFLLLN